MVIKSCGKPLIESVQEPFEGTLNGTLSTQTLQNPLYKSRNIASMIRLMDKILHDPKDPKLWELWYIPYNG